MEEGYLDVEMLENMLKRMLNTQAIKMGAASQDMSEREFTGKETEAEARAKIREDTKKKNKKN